MKNTDGERIANEACAAAIVSGNQISWLAKKIDRLVARRQAEAWDKCYLRICESDLVLCADLKVERDENPYRKGGKR